MQGIQGENVTVDVVAGGPGLCDPCEKDPKDAATSLTNQEREDITASAQVSHVVSQVQPRRQTAGKSNENPLVQPLL